MLLLDTNVVGEFGRLGAEAAVQQWMATQAFDQLYTSSVTIGEVAFGIESLPAGRRKRDFQLWFERLVQLFDGRILQYDRDAAMIWGRLRARLRKAGAEKPALDLQIASIALKHGMPLVTRNERDFAGLELTLVNPWTTYRTSP